MEIAKSHLKELRTWMKRTQTSQRTLARYTGLGEPTFSKVMNGTRHFSPDAAGKLAALTGIPVEKLLTDEESSQILKLLGKRLNSSGKKSNDKSRVA